MRRMHLLTIAMLGLLLASCGSVGIGPSPDAQKAVAPTGKLRAGLLLGDATQVTRDPATGETKGVGLDLGAELARRMRLPYEPVLYQSIGALLDGGKAAGWDVAFIGFTPERAKEWEFAAPHLEVEFGYLVGAGSSISTLADVDRPGNRVAVQERSGPDTFLSRTLKSASIVRAPSYADALELQKSGKADAIFSIKPILFELSIQLPGSRVLDGRAGVVPQALAMPKGRAQGMSYARKFIEDAKAEGLVKAGADRAGLRGVVVAPPSAN